MAQITNEMATNLTLDIGSAQKSLRELTSTVKDSNNEWKIQEAQLKASGDAANASKARYEGLQNTLSEQKNKVDALKQALDNNNTETKKGQELQTYLTNELAKAERQYASYQGQLDKATQSYKYQESGLAKLNDELKQSNDLTDARARKLESEGHVEEAQKIRLDGLKNAQANYTKQLEIQTSELNKLADSGDKSSESYKRQELRVAQMGAKLAQTEREIKDFNRTEIKPETSGMNKVRDQLRSLDEALEGTRSRFKTIFMANLAANGVYSAFENIKEKISETLEGAKEYNKEQQVMNATWLTLTGNAGQGKDMVNSINQISTAFGQSNDVVNELSQQFYHVFNQKEPTEQLTKSMLTLGDTLGMNAADVERLGLNFTHMLTSGRMQLGDFNMITDQLPMYGEKLLEYEQKVQNNSKLTMAQLRDQMSAGKVSAHDATEVMNELGDKYKTASENMMNTATGMERVMQARGKALAGALIQPIMNAQNPVFGAVSKWVSDPKTEQEFNKVGDQISKSFGTITAAFGKSFSGKDFTSNADAFLNKTSDAIKRFGDYIAKHADDIRDFFKMVRELGTAGFGALGATLKIAIPLLEQVGKFASSHPTLFKVLAGSVIGFDLALKGTLRTIRSIEDTKQSLAFLKGLVIKPKVDTGDAKRELGVLGTAFNFLKTNPFALAITAITTLSFALYELYKHNEKFREFVNGILKSAKGVFDKLKDVTAPVIQSFKIFGNTIKEVFVDSFNAAEKAISPFIKLFKSAFSGLDSEFSDIFKSIGKSFGGILKPFSDAGKKGGAIQSVADALDGVSKWFIQNKSLFTTIGSLISKSIGTEIAAVGIIIRGFVNITLPLIKPAINIVVAVIKGALSTIGNAFKIAWNGIKLVFDLLTFNWKNLGNDVKGIANGISGVITSVFKTMGAVVANIFNALVKVIDKALWSIGLGTKPIESFVKGTINLFNYLWKTTTNVFRDIADFISGTINDISRIWSKVWSNIFNFFGSIWDKISRYGRDSVNGVSNVIHDVLGGIGNVWRGTWQGLSDFFGGIWRSIKGYASDGINGVLNVINAGVDAIDSVWKFFTGHETSIHHLQPVKFAQGGVVTQRLAMVNDGDGPDWKELIQLPNGDMKMSQQRNAVMPLPVGTRVYNGKETKAIMNYMGIEKYAGGGIVGGAINWAKGALSDVGSWIGDKFDAIDAFLKNPLSAVQGLISKAVDPLISSLGNFGQLASGVFDKLMSPLSDWFTKGLKKVQDEGQGAPAGAGVQRWADQVKQALSANGLSTSDGMVQKVLRQIQTESGGNEKAVQGGYTDVNTISGDLAKGLMQTISATFNAYAFPGHHNIFNGYDNLLAALAYAKNRYGSNLSYLGQGHGYANGGLITQHQIAEIGEGNKPEMIIPLDGMKSSRGFELLGKTAVAMAARDGKTSQGVSDGSEVTQLLSQNNQLLGVVTQILGAILGETEKGNEPLSALSINRLSRLITSSTVRSAN